MTLGDWRSGSNMVYIKSLVLALGSFFLPIKPLLLLVALFICFDTFLGIWGAYKRGEKITSRKLGGIIPKMLLYQLTIIFGFMLDTLLLTEFVKMIVDIDLFITKLIAMILIFVETVSINENFESITGKNLFKEGKNMITRARKLKGDIGNIKDDEDSTN
jgi:hypothetical protein